MSHAGGRPDTPPTCEDVRPVLHEHHIGAVHHANLDGRQEIRRLGRCSCPAVGQQRGKAQRRGNNDICIIEINKEPHRAPVHRTAMHGKAHIHARAAKKRSPAMRRW